MRTNLSLHKSTAGFFFTFKNNFTSNTHTMGEKTGFKSQPCYKKTKQTPQRRLKDQDFCLPSWTFVSLGHRKIRKTKTRDVLQQTPQ